MKKVIGIVAVVTIIAALAAVISFATLDAYKMFQSRIWNRHKQSEEIQEALKDAGTQIKEALTEAGADIKEGMNQAADGVEKGLEGAGNSIADNLGNSDELSFVREIADRLENGGQIMNVEKILNDSYIEDGYIGERHILKTQKRIVKTWTQSLEPVPVKKIKIDAENINLLIAHTKAKEIEVWLAESETMEKNDQVAADWTVELMPEGEYRIFPGSSQEKMAEENYTLYLLLPENCQAEIEAEITNANIIGAWIENKADLEVTNGNILLNQTKNNDLALKLTNGDIIVNLASELDARLDATVTNGNIVGFGKISDHRYKKVYGHGKYEIDLEAENGNIIGK